MILVDSNVLLRLAQRPDFRGYSEVKALNPFDAHLRPRVIGKAESCIGQHNYCFSPSIAARFCRIRAMS